MSDTPFQDSFGWHGPPVNFTEPPPDPVGYARAADGSLVPVGVPVNNSAAARLWRLPTQFVPASLAFAAPLLTVAFNAVVAWLIFRWLERTLK